MQSPSTPSRYMRTALAALVAGAVLAPSAGARWNDDTRAEGSLVDVQLIVGGRPAPLYPSPQGDERRYIQAVEGGNYSIQLRNNTRQRVGVLIAVDGLNVVNGERTALSSGEPMYVLDPWESTTIQGWRTSLDEVQRFVFVDEARSYAERTGQANGDMGWIRVLAFREQRMWRERRPINPWYGGPSPELRQGYDKAAPPAPQSESKGRQPDAMEKHEGLAGRAEDDSYPGTGWGERRHDSVRTVRFTAERFATDQHVIRYEYASGLRALGIFPDYDRLHGREHGTLGFAQPPR